ncbi:MAG: ABC1 kinase family protein [bacterium]
MSIYTFPFRMKNIRRLREIVNILALHGFGFIVDSLGLSWLVTLGGHIKGLSRVASKTRWTLPERVRIVLEDLGPTFVKFGQLLSLRPDLVPKEFIREFSKLLDEASAVPFKEIEIVLIQELGDGWRDNFSFIDEKPFRSASLSQVYRARLKDGRDVVIKVQRPNIRDLVKQDLEILTYIAERLTKRVPELRVYNPTGIVRELKKTISRELNFYLEAANTDRMRDFLISLDYIVIPDIIWHLTTTGVLTLEYISGVSLKELVKKGIEDFNGKLIAQRLINAFLKMIFEEGFFHTDPHPGNVLILEGDRIALLDCGQVAVISEQTKGLFSKVLFALVNRQTENIAREIEKYWIVEDEEKVEGLREDIDYIIKRYYGLPLKYINISELINEIADIAREHALQAPQDVVFLAKTVATLESECRMLDPSLDVILITKPYAYELIKRQSSPKRFYRNFLEFAISSAELLYELPEQLYFILKKIRKGTLKMEFHHKGLDELIYSIDTSSRRLSLAMIITGLVIGSSFLISSNTKPLIFGVSFFGMFGYIISAVLGLWVILSILRGRRW